MNYVRRQLLLGNISRVGHRYASALEKLPEQKSTETSEEDATKQSNIDPISGLPFRKLHLIPKRAAERPIVETTKRPYDRPIPIAREKRMRTDQDWPSTWPTAHTFKQTVVPLPIRMGFQTKLQKPPPQKTGNLELMKIPNFLHLTPPAIRRHCEALQKFCTPWPEELNDENVRRKHFPIEVVYCDYVHAGPSIRDARSRIVTAQVRLSDLNLGGEETRARHKFIKLVGDLYDKKSDTVSIVTDRCPSRTQNYNYAMYLLAVLYHESLKFEEWEKDITPADKLISNFNDSKSRSNMLDMIKRMKAAYEAGTKSTKQPEALDQLKRLQNSFPDYIKQMKKSSDELTEEDVLNLPVVRSYVDQWSKYLNSAETPATIKAYGDGVRQLLGVRSIDGEDSGLS